MSTGATSDEALPVEVAGFTPVRLDTANGADKGRVVVFSLDGTDYTAPLHPPAGVALEYLRVVAERGEDAGLLWMLTRLLGEKGVTALAQHDALTHTQLQQVIAVCRRLLFGGLERPKENSPSV